MCRIFSANPKNCLGCDDFSEKNMHFLHIFLHISSKFRYFRSNPILCGLCYRYHGSRQALTFKFQQTQRRATPRMWLTSTHTKLALWKCQTRILILKNLSILQPSDMAVSNIRKFLLVIFTF